MIDFLEWLARAGGILALLVSALGYVFREKWKQLLQRSLAEDLERLKSDLVKAQAEHAASLTPQLEQIKHDFQQKLEAYKVSLIAETEAVKAKGELKKTIALRYAEIEFERLVSLEHAVSPLTSEMIALASVDADQKTVEQESDAIKKLLDLGVATDKAEMFMPGEDQLELIQLRQRLLEILRKHIGLGKPVFDMGDAERSVLLKLAAGSHTKLMNKIRSIGML